MGGPTEWAQQDRDSWAAAVIPGVSLQKEE
jgi:hypothetical protein